MRNIVLSFMIIAFLTGTTLAADKVRFAIHFKLSPHYVLPVLAALEKGYWKAQGLEVQYFPFDAGTVMDRGVVAGDIDMGTQGLASMIMAASMGIPEVMVTDPDIVTEFYFWVRTDSPLKEPKDVKGARIGVTRFGIASHNMARAVVKALGIEEKDVKYIATGTGPSHVAALKAGAIDIATLSDFAFAPLKFKGEVRELIRMEDYLPKGVTAQIVFARRDFIQKNPALVKKVAKGFLQGAEFVIKNPGWAMEKMQAEFKYPLELSKGVLPWLKYDIAGKIDETKIKNAVDFLVGYGLVAKEKVPSLDKLYAGGFTD